MQSSTNANHYQAIAIIVHVTTGPLLRQAGTDLPTAKGGVKGKKIKDVLAINDSCDNINTRRECILRGLVIYLNEDPDSLFKEYLASAPQDAERDLANTVMGIYMIRRDVEPEDVGIVMEGIKVLNNVDSVMAFIMLFGLIYALDISSPDTS